jgi:hypothetical protein
VNDVSAILPNFFTFTGNDYVRDPELKKLVEAGSATADPDQRRKANSSDQADHREGLLDADLHPLVTYGSRNSSTSSRIRMSSAFFPGKVAGPAVERHSATAL